MSKGRNEMIDEFKLLFYEYRSAQYGAQESELELKLIQHAARLVDELISSRAEAESIKPKLRDTVQEETLKIMRAMAERAPTLRDYFAAAALQGLLANSDLEGTAGAFVSDAWEYADAMLAAREKAGGAIP